MLNPMQPAPDLGTLAPQPNPAASPWEGCAYLAPRCSICAHPQVGTLSQMLTGHLLKQDGERYRLGDIVTWAGLKGAPVSKAALSRHLSRHLRPKDAPAGEPQPSTVTTGARVGRHLKRAAEALVLGVFEQVRVEFADALEEAVRGVGRPPVRLEGHHPDKRLDVDTPGESVTPEQTPVKPPMRPRKAAGKGNRQRSMPRDFQSALKLEAALNRIQAMPRGMRATLLKELAAEYGKDAHTARRWLSAYEQHGLAGIMQAKRSDSGGVRIPAAAVRALQQFVEAYPHLSARKLYALLKEQQPELLEYAVKQGSTRQVSITTLAKLVRQVRHPVEGPGEGQKLSDSSQSAEHGGGR